MLRLCPRVGVVKLYTVLLKELNSALDGSDRKVSEETEDIVPEFHENYRI